MAQLSATERTIKLATRVATLPDAWAFVMEHIDSMGDNPTVNIGPVWEYDEELDSRVFEVTVEGMIEG